MKIKYRWPSWPDVSRKLIRAWVVWSFLTVSASLAITAGVEARIVLPSLLLVLPLTLLLFLREPTATRQGIDSGPASDAAVSWPYKPSVWSENAGLVVLLLVSLTVSAWASIEANRIGRTAKELASDNKILAAQISQVVITDPDFRSTTGDDAAYFKFLGCFGSRCRLSARLPEGESSSFRILTEKAEAYDGQGNVYRIDDSYIRMVSSDPIVLAIELSFVGPTGDSASDRIRSIRLPVELKEGVVTMLLRDG